MEVKQTENSSEHCMNMLKQDICPRCEKPMAEHELETMADCFDFSSEEDKADFQHTMTAPGVMFMPNFNSLPVRRRHKRNK